MFGTVLIVCFGAAAAYCAIRWNASNTENDRLRGQVASLKRQLAHR